MKTILPLLLLSAFFILAAAAQPALAAGGSSVIDTVHNLAPLTMAENVQGRVCIFCHTPHHSSDEGPLWSRNLSAQDYDMYQSDTMLATIADRPQGSSRLCLSCHDGTIALGLLAGLAGYTLDDSLKSFDAMPPPLDPLRNPNLGTDLSDDHPISFEYLWKPELALPAQVGALGVRLGQDNYVECTSCHDPHDNQNGNFLVVNVATQLDTLCTICHRRNEWDDSYPDTVHRSGGERYPTVAAGVAAAGCLNCHLTHNAPGQVLLKGATVTETCTTVCHHEAPYRDVLGDFEKFYKHPLGGVDSRHSAGESLPVVAETNNDTHVECVDCHNPHRAGWDGAPMGTVSPVIGAVTPPEISAALRAVRVENIESGGRTADYEYEICFKCHAGIDAQSFVDEASLLNPLPERQYSSFDEAVRFAGSSFHPVTYPRPERGGDTGRSLKEEYKVPMERIYCIDCHAPHGADYPHLLTSSNIDTYPAGILPGNLDIAYPLCFTCHDSNYLINQSASQVLHNSHVINHEVPCATCHDPHGVPALNGANLINFDLRYAAADPPIPPIPTYDPIGRSCSVACHTTGSPDPKTHTY